MEKELCNTFIAKPGEKHKVSSFPTKNTSELTKLEGEVLLEENRGRLSELQDKLYAQDKYAVLIVFQAMDAAGKDGTIKHVIMGVNPAGFQVYSFKQPSREDLDHDYLWRVYKNLSERGRIGIFNRSHYEDVLISKVHPEMLLKNNLPDVKTLKDVNKDFWERRYRQINDFEQHLTENGTVIIKFFLNVSKKEQEERFLSRLNDESKNWKFSSSDLEERKFWNDYMKAYSDILTYTSTDYAPWYVIPADNKWFMRYIVSQIIYERIGEIKPDYPRLTAKEKKELQEIKKILQKNNCRILHSVFIVKEAISNIPKIQVPSSYHYKALHLQKMKEFLLNLIGCLIHNLLLFFSVIYQNQNHL